MRHNTRTLPGPEQMPNQPLQYFPVSPAASGSGAVLIYVKFSEILTWDQILVQNQLPRGGPPRFFLIWSDLAPISPVVIPDGSSHFPSVGHQVGRSCSLRSRLSTSAGPCSTPTSANTTGAELLKRGSPSAQRTCPTTEPRELTKL